MARARLPGGRIEAGDIEALPFADATFDVVTGLNAFQFAADPIRALGEARRVCRPGGTVLMLVGTARALRGALGDGRGARAAAAAAGGGASSLAVPGTVEAVVERAGLRPTRSSSIKGEPVYASAPAIVAIGGRDLPRGPSGRRARRRCARRSARPGAVREAGSAGCD